MATTTGDLGRASVEVRAIGDARCGVVGLAVEPDELLELNGQRGREQRHVDERALAGVARANERGEDTAREQEPCREVGHRYSAGTHRNRVSTRRVRREQSGARLGDEVVSGCVGERARRTERAHAPDDEGGVCGVEVVPLEPKARSALGPEVVQSDVRAVQQACAPSRALPPS